MEKINHALEETDNGDAKILKAFIEGLEKKEYNMEDIEPISGV